jgi:3-carboxy-cis,cis-muconate cycloisomerase
LSSELFGPTVVTDELATATSDEAWLRALLDAEVALARAEAEAGVIPAAAAIAIAAAAVPASFDLAAIGRDARAGGNPVIPLVAALAAAVGDDAAGWVHWGATSQDIMDSAQMLVAARSALLIDASLADLADGCARLAELHGDTVMAGRTLLQQALPVTFGLAAAGWLNAVVDTRRMLRPAQAALAAQLGGAVGTLASLGHAGPEVAARFAAHLGLAEPPLPWHTARQRVAALAAALGIAAGTAAKIAGDIALLMQTEVAEVAEPGAPGRGGSSTLPHKRNPVAAASVGAAARQAVALVPVLLGSLVAEHQRPVGAWQAEWETVPRLLALAGSAVEHTARTVRGLEVDPDTMAANLDRTHGALMAERVALALATKVDGGHQVGRPAAKAAMEEVARAALSSGRDLAGALAAHPLAGRLLTASEIRTLLDPAGYLGATGTWIDRALAAHRQATKELAPTVFTDPMGGAR